METYYLDTLIYFFKTQRDLDYVAIDDVLNIIDDNEIPEAVRRDMIMDTLRGYGLNETSYRYGRFSPGIDSSPADRCYNNIHDKISYTLQSMRLQILNGSIGINIPLN